ncbi:MerR family transcriptional regulator [Paenibacillus sp. GCM10027626]|uniref:MerR family transcriptional regulator n=1 Tax=Paenibacillus sp. GCM10027626 TaxID=3273411 RepID=UPI00363499D2
MYSIGEVAKMIGSKVRTVRYYDEIGLVKPSSYTEGGHRLYTTEDIWRLELTTTLRYLDFGIDEISQLISGELPVEKALDWQIESLTTQVSALTNMISILRQAKQHQGDSLRYVYDLVHEKALNIEKRKQFISEKVEIFNIFDGIPSEWRGPMLYFFNKYIVNQAKITAKQTAAWNELQELMNDPQFMRDLKNIEFFFFHTNHQPRYNALTWVRRLEDIHDRLNQALEKKRAADSPYVQAIVEEMIMLYANSEQAVDKEAFIRSFAEYAQKTRTPLLERCNTLCSILSPQFNLLSKGNLVLFQSLQRKLEQMSNQSCEQPKG